MAVGLPLLAVAVSFLVAGRLIAPVNRPVPKPKNFGAHCPLTSVQIPGSSKHTLAAWHIEKTSATATVILLHPLRADRRAMLGRARLFCDEGFSVLMIDFQGHGESRGDAITMGYREQHDVTAAIDYIRKSNPDHKIGVVGWSLGGAAALMAKPIDIDVLVLESVYENLTDAIHHRIAMRAGPLHHVLAPALTCQLKPRLGFSADQLRPIDHLKEVSCPVLIASGDQDQHTPLAATNRLFDAAAEPKRRVIFNGAKHEDLLQHDTKKYQNEVVQFVKSHLGVL